MAEKADFGFLAIGAAIVIGATALTILGMNAPPDSGWRTRCVESRTEMLFIPTGASPGIGINLGGISAVPKTTCIREERYCSRKEGCDGQ